MSKRNHALYEQKYQAFYDAGVDFVSATGYDDEYRQFLSLHPSRGRLIECGCGEGFACAMAASLGYEVLGVDSAPSAIAKAIETHSGCSPSLSYAIADITELNEVASESFDVLADIGCLHMIGDQQDAERYLSHAFRVLKANGQAYFQNRVSPAEAKRWFPKMSAWIDEWYQRCDMKPAFESEEFQVGGRTVIVDVPKHLGAIFRDAAEYVQLLTGAGFCVERLHVKTPGVNSPFEAVIIASKKDVS